MPGTVLFRPTMTQILFSGIQTLLPTCVLKPATHPSPHKLQHWHIQNWCHSSSSLPKAIHLLLSPFWYTTPSATSLKPHISLLLSTRPCLMSCNNLCLPSKSWPRILNGARTHSHWHFPGSATIDLAWAVATALHLVLLTHFMTLTSDPDPDHGPRGAWWKADGESKGMFHPPLHCAIYALFTTFTNDTKQMSHMTRWNSRPFPAWVSPWFLELDIFQGVLTGHKSTSNNKMFQRGKETSAYFKEIKGTSTEQGDTGYMWKEDTFFVCVC